MRRLTVVVLSSAVLLWGSGGTAAQGTVRMAGRATVEYRSPDVNAVAVYDYSQRNHDGAWVLIEFAVQAAHRIAVHRDEITLVTPDERVVPLASQEQFLEDHEALTQLLQNAKVWRRPLDSYFRTRPQPTIRFFAHPGGLVHDSAATNRDEVAAGDLFFKSPDGRWPAATYRLRLNHAEAKAELPIRLE